MRQDPSDTETAHCHDKETSIKEKVQYKAVFQVHRQGLDIRSSVLFVF
jgi:hypothetical protein